MRKKIISIGIISGIALAIIVAFMGTSEPEPEPGIDSEKLADSKSEMKSEKSGQVIDADIIMPTKVSRPGCEINDSCYVPSVITINQGEQVTWANEDVAFHSVTSGTYESPTGLFDSGHMDPGQKFTVSFNEKGDFDFFCTLHPWMKGKVIVQ